MKTSQFEPGDCLKTTFVVEPKDWASFEGETIHEVCSTYALAKEAEWACRQFVLKMREDHEEGIGHGLSIHHKSPAMTGQSVEMQATLLAVDGMKVECTWEAKVGDRLVAYGTCAQTVWRREKIAEHWKSYVIEP